MLPCNWTAVCVFLDLGTQWRVSPLGGRIGIDYAALPAVLALRGIKRKRRAGIFEQIMTMERAALEAMRSD